jgi:3-dehydroquinate dehydratase/shikimate dehydrogenase
VSQLERLALNACDNGEDFLEIRLDLLERAEDGIAVIRRVLRRYPETVILATCRRKQNGGAFRGSIPSQMAILEDAVNAGAAIVDIEIETAETAPDLLEPFHGRARLMVSYHNFEATPALSRVLRRLEKIPADLYKLATLAKKPTDALRVLELPAGHSKQQLVMMAMGEVGTPPRILGPARGSAFAFAAPNPKKEAPRKRSANPLKATPTAPGQISACDLRNRYQVPRRKASTKVYGVVADPVAHSMSPVLHNRAFQSRRVDAVYIPFLVQATKLSDFFKVVEALPVTGFSVTIPHKQRVLRHLDAVDSLARRIGAVNTVYRKRGKLCGTNTDALGVTVPLEKRIKLAKASVLIVGNGGAARGAIVALQDKGARITLTGRNPAHVRRLARNCGVEALDRGELGASHFDVMVHATSLGMYPHVDGCFFEDRIPADLVFDMVYNPLETRLIREAASQGKKTISGLEMFLEQAAAQFEIWTGQSAPRTTMRNAVLGSFESQDA